MFRYALAASLLELTSPANAATQPSPASANAATQQVSLGRYTFPGPGTVNTWWIETPSSVIVIDVQRDLEHAREALATIKRIGKPVSAILVTHGHPDHYAGIGLFRAAFPSAIAYASATTARTIADDHYGFNALLQQAGPGNFPSPVEVPSRIITPDETLTIDGVTIVTREFGRSDANSMTAFYLPQSGDLFSGDLILSGMHSFFYEGASADWLASLDRLTAAFPAARMLHLGHGEPGAPAVLIGAQRSYIVTARALAADAIARLGPTAAAQTDTIAALQRRFPNAGNPVGLPNMLDLSTAGLFRELTGIGEAPFPTDHN